MNGTKKKSGKAKATLSAVTPAAAKSAKPSTKIDSAIDLETVRELARILEEFGLTEVYADPSGQVRVSRVSSSAAFAAPVIAAPPASIALAPPPPVEGVAESGTFVTSPFVGTFYRAPSPEAAVFAEVGQTVRKGQVVCIVEAMKLMNEIESESDGKIVEILAKNGDHVEYGQKLFRIA
ncbi:MAG TPA: acetyl-CoA carboxylase biotin carboxyl carrier protein [Polyangia bacterium]|nr:acetyl-CoA carboxylase biotin carboxyl carrier protein [Polyangia bacterium]